jgi:hypothetical protein
MKKWIAGIAVVIFLLLCSVYIFIPSNLVILNISTFNCTPNGAYRYLSEENKWRKWWVSAVPDAAGKIDFMKQPLTYGSSTYHITEQFTNGVSVLIGDKNDTVPSSLQLFAKGTDSVLLEWRCHLTSSRNPFKRMLQYRRAVAIKNNMTGVIENMRAFLENTDNIYTISIRESSTTDSLLIATKNISTFYPGTLEIYNFLKPLKAYIMKEGAIETGQPMVNVTKLNDHQFQTMVAIPIDKGLNAEGDFFPRTLVHGHFMVAEIKGGPYTVNKALEEMQLYFEDYKKTSMAIPFQSLITDRMKEPDTSKWVTKIYAPVMR